MSVAQFTSRRARHNNGNVCCTNVVAASGRLAVTLRAETAAQPLALVIWVVTYRGGR